MPTTPYNPLDKGSIGDNIVRELISHSCQVLPSPKGKLSTLPRDDAFEGAGIYAIYYVGSFPAYAHIAATNVAGNCSQPIYIGKADPKGGRKGALELDASRGTSLYNRLKDHATSIDQASNLDLSDFRCRYLAVDDIWISLGERRAIQSYLPLWNTLIDGFGNHDPGNRRKDQYQSDWDVVHPGRSWATKLGRSPKTVEQILASVTAPPSKPELEELAASALREKQSDTDE